MRRSSRARGDIQRHANRATLFGEEKIQSLTKSEINVSHNGDHDEAPFYIFCPHCAGLEHGVIP